MLEERLLDHTRKYIVGVSGGCDSMTLLDLLRLHNYQVVVTHVNYHLREDSDVDMHLVQNYCKKYNIPCYVLNLKKDDYHKDNFQKQAREMRYSFYKEIAQKENCDAVVLGHHQDDVLETIYMQKQRNNYDSFLGIQEVTEIQGIKVIRPFLNIRKQDILNYCKEQHLEYHDDYTNFQDHFTRDYVRNRVLNEYNEEQKQELLQEAKVHNDAFLTKMKILKPIFDKYDQQHVLNYKDLKQEYIEDIIFYMLKQDIYPPKIHKSLIEEIVKELYSSSPNLHISLPVNKEFIKEYDNIYIGNNNQEAVYSYQYNQITYEKTEYFELSKTGNLNYGVCITEEDLPITIRTFHPGDILESSGGRKKVSRIFINAKVPADQRKKWPIVVNKKGDIILIPGLAKNKAYLYTKPNVFVLKCEA